MDQTSSTLDARVFHECIILERLGGRTGLWIRREVMSEYVRFGRERERGDWEPGDWHLGAAESA